MITYTHPVARNFPMKTLVARQLPTNNNILASLAIYVYMCTCTYIVRQSHSLVIFFFVDSNLVNVCSTLLLYVVVIFFTLGAVPCFQDVTCSVSILVVYILLVACTLSNFYRE